MRKNNINEIYMGIINESRPRWLLNDVKVITRNVPTLVQIKEAVLNLAKMNDWNSFVDSQQRGECALIAQSVSRMFPKMEFYSVLLKFSDKAISQMKPDNDPDAFICSHYLNRYKDRWFDFGKGTNRYEGIYVLDGIDDMYSCLYSENIEKYLIDPRKEDPKAIGISLR